MVPIRRWRHDAYQRYIDIIECFVMMITVYVVVAYDGKTLNKDFAKDFQGGQRL
jgi:hypothetical protein